MPPRIHYASSFIIVRAQGFNGDRGTAGGDEAQLSLLLMVSQCCHYLPGHFHALIDGSHNGYSICLLYHVCIFGLLIACRVGQFEADKIYGDIIDFTGYMLLQAGSLTRFIHL